MKIFVLLLLAGTLCAQLLIHTIADFTGDAAAHPVSTTATAAKWVQFVAPVGNSAVVRVGDSAVGVSRGVPIAAGAGWKIGTDGSGFPAYDLSKIYYYAGSGDKLSVTWGQ